MKELIPVEIIEKKIYLIRGQKVMLSSNLAELYGVEPKVLIQAVKRNLERFPADFMFQLSNQEFVNLKSQIVTSSWGGIRRANPYAFTEQGIAMLSSVLRSKRAIEVNIHIMRAFVKLRELMATRKDLARKLADMEKKYDAQFKVVFDAIRQLVTPPEPKKRKIGFEVRERRARYGTSGRKRPR
ncbi:MAG: ORF6N domain-containing protein [Nitrospirae bacterium]|nr:ORF6N domain-containing protein [Nitrospirota bacterium]